jgi:hypothetical protein
MSVSCVEVVYSNIAIAVTQTVNSLSVPAKNCGIVRKWQFGKFFK